MLGFDKFAELPTAAELFTRKREMSTFEHAMWCSQIDEISTMSRLRLFLVAHEVYDLVALRHLLCIHHDAEEVGVVS